MSVLRNSIQLITKHIAYWALFIAVIFTVLVATVYWVSNAIEQRKDEIAQWIGDELNYPVEVGDAGLHWVGAKPKLHLQSVTVFQNDGRTKLLSLSELYFGLDIVKSIHNGDPVLNDITLIGLNLRLVRDEFSEFQVQGFNKLKPKAVTTENMDWLNAVRSLNSFNFQSITVDYIDQITPSLSGVYKLRNSTLNYKGKRWATKATLKLPVGFGDDIQVQAEGQLNDNLLKADWQWQIDASQLQL
ncbi:MAG: hypothetical protein IMF04_04095, partial [Proteobacteria bacterium]|nr:hypothetical protein [Pseudomonadota bacterium]